LAEVGQNRWVTGTDVVDLVRILARQMPDEAIAAVLNRSGKSTGRGNSWTRMRVSSLHHNHTYIESALDAAADLLGRYQSK
jgi:hypothetical protein